MICAQVGHNFQLVNEKVKDVKEEKCLDCGTLVTFRSTNWNEDKEYSKAHRRDFIQPNDPLWKIAYPNKPVITDPQRKKEIALDLQLSVGVKRKKNIAEEYLRSFGWDKMQEILKWHFGMK